MSHFAATATAWLFGSTIASANLTGAILSALFLSGLAVYPVLNFVVHGWGIKKQDISSSFSTEAKRTYLESFLKMGKVSDADKAFEAFYVGNYGRMRFVIPLVLLFAVCFSLMFLFSETAIS
jgi:hypothetical protein